MRREAVNRRGSMWTVTTLLLWWFTTGWASQAADTSYLQLRIEQYDVAATVSLADYKVQVQATLTITNPSERAIAQMEFKLAEKAQIKSVSVNETLIQPTTRVSERTRTLNVTFSLGQALGPGQSTTVVFYYDLPVEEAAARAALTVDEQALLPESFWIPMIHTPYLLDYNADMAPFRLRVIAPAAMKVIASGERVSESSQGDTTVTTYRQTLLAQPLFIARDVQMAATGEADVELYLPRDYTMTNLNTVQRVRDEIRRIAKFYTAFFGQPTPHPVRVIASSQIPLYGAPGFIIVDERAFARDIVDDDTIFFMASTLARCWLGGRYLVQGAGHGVLLDGLPSYLALLYVHEQYGRPAVDRIVERFRADYARIVSGASAYDAPLVRQSLLNREYYTSVFNKVPLVMRLIEREIGRDKLTGVIKTFFSGPTHQPRTLEALRTMLLSVGDPARLRPLFENWFDRVVLPDLAVGKPVFENGAWSVNIANFGDGSGDVDVEITLPSGEKHRRTVKFESEGYAKAVFDVPQEPALAHVDPDQYYLQARYDNDTFPRKPVIGQLIGQATLALVQGKAAEAEPKARQAIEAEPYNLVARSLLARALAALGRLEEAEQQARDIIREPWLSLTAYANAQLALGDVSMKRQQAASAVLAYRQAALAFAEDASLLPVRDLLIQAERMADQLVKADEAVQTFMTQFDAAVSTGTPSAVRGLVEQGNLKAFTIGVAFIKSWKSEILRAQRLDAHRVALDVQAQVVTGERQRTVKAIFTLRKQPTGWRLYDIPVFVEK